MGSIIYSPILYGMKSILFVVCADGSAAAGNKLFQDYPYGHTDKTRWEVVLGNPFGLSAMLPHVPSSTPHLTKIQQEYESILLDKMHAFDLVIDMRMSSMVRSPSWDDYAVIPSDDSAHRTHVTYLATPYVFVDTENLFGFGKIQSDITRITLLYQKTFDVYGDYERMLADFERMIHEDVCTFRKQHMFETRHSVRIPEKMQEDITSLRDCEDIPSVLVRQTGITVPEEHVACSVPMREGMDHWIVATPNSGNA